MNTHVSQENKLLDCDKSWQARDGNLPATAGTFALRRNHYLNEQRASPGTQIRRDDVVISFETASLNLLKMLDNEPFQLRRV